MSTTADRRIALLKPASADEDKITHAMQLFDSILWAFKGTTRSTWTTVPPEAAEVIVVHQGDTDERIATWQAGGKRLIEIVTREPANPSGGSVLVYPFRATQVLALLERLDAELDFAGGSPQQKSADPNSGSEAVAARDPWSFVETLRTIREVQNSEAWLVARDGKLPCLWLRADGAMYLAEQSTVQAIRRGTLDLSKLNLQKSTTPAGGPTPRAGTELSWFAGYHASDRIAPWLQEAGRYKVIRWPNFGLIRPLPSHIRVAAVMASAPSQLNEIAMRAQVTIEEATRTLNALAVADVVVAAENDAPPAKPARSAAAQPRGGISSFLRNMRKHLGLGT
jgi:hypothetical protein